MDDEQLSDDFNAEGLTVSEIEFAGVEVCGGMNDGQRQVLITFIGHKNGEDGIMVDGRSVVLIDREAARDLLVGITEAILFDGFSGGAEVIYPESN